MRTLLLLLMLPSLAVAAQPDVAIVTDLKGEVLRRAKTANGWNAASLDEGLALLDLIRTGAQSKTEMRFIDRTVLAIGEKTRLRISLALFDVDRAPEPARIALMAGRLDVAVHASAQPLVITAPSGQQAQLNPGQRARARVVDGKLIVSALPESVRFTSDIADDWWLDDADDPTPSTLQQPPGVIAPGNIDGALDPLDDEAFGPGATGVDLTLTPRQP